MTTRLWVPVLLAAVLSCGDPTGTPEAVLVHLTTPNTDDGAVAMTITGTGFATVEAADDAYHVLARQEAPDTLLLLVFGNLRDGPVVRLLVEDAGRVRDFVGHVTEVARRNNTLVENRAFYRVAFTAED